MTLIMSLIPLILGLMIVIIALVKKLKPKTAVAKIPDIKIEKNKEVRFNGQSNRN